MRQSGEVELRGRVVEGGGGRGGGQSASDGGERYGEKSFGRVAAGVGLVGSRERRDRGHVSDSLMRQ